MQIVEIVLYFAVGQFAVDQVAEVVVVIAAAVVGFQAIVGCGFGLDCYGKNILDDLEKGLRSSEKQKPRYPTSGLEVSCGLRLAKINHTYHKFHEYNLLLIFLFFVLLLMHSKEFYSTTCG